MKAPRKLAAAFVLAVSATAVTGCESHSRWRDAVGACTDATVAKENARRDAHAAPRVTTMEALTYVKDCEKKTPRR